MLGTVARLRRYPVKSMLGEEVAASDVTFSGLAGDRRFAVVSTRTGKLASAKYPRAWRAMLTMAATACDGAVRIRLPDGTITTSADDGVDEVLSEVLGEPVTLASTPPPGASLDRAVPEAVLSDGVAAEVPAKVIEVGKASPEGLFFDYAPVHLLTTSTLDRVAGLSSGGEAAAERYRPNIIIRTAAAGFAENDWVGRTVGVGSDLVLRVIARTGRCAVPTLAHGDLPRDTEALRVLARHNRIPPMPEADPEPCAGVYAQVLNPGHVSTSDPVRFC
jgi:uncharacterized protein YcbX